MQIRSTAPAPIARRPLTQAATASAPKAAPRVRAATAGYQGAIAKIKAEIAAEGRLPLQPGSESRLYVHPNPSPKGTIVMYHGFTAGGWQFEPMAQKAFEAGYNVYIPRLPGHGYKDDAGEDDSQLVRSNQKQRYFDFAERTYQEAKALGGPVHVMGLSVGGNIALAVAEKHADVKSVTAYAPFVQPKAGSILFGIFHVLDKVTFGLAGRLLNLVPFGWGKEAEEQTASGLRPGHAKFKLGHIYAASEMGRELIKNAEKIQAPVQFFTTAVDDAAKLQSIQAVHDKSGGDPENGWYFYHENEGVPHPMVHPMEAKDAKHLPGLYDMTLQFLETGKPIDRD